MCPICLVNLTKAAGDTMRFRDISQVLLEAGVDAAREPALLP